MGAARGAASAAGGRADIAGRTVERARLEAALDDLLEGERGIVLIKGRPGVGKTHLLRWMLECASTRGVRTAMVRPPSAIPLSSRALLEQVLAAFGTSVGIERAGGDESLVLAVAERIGDIVGEGPALLAVDDMRAVGPEARRVLIDAIRLTDATVGIACSWRDVADAHDADELGAHGELPLTTVELTGLTREEAAVFAAQRLGGEPLGSLVDRLHARTLGVPLFMVELLRRWRAAGSIAEVGGRYALEDDGVGVTTSLDDALAAATGELKPDELLVARTLAVAAIPQTFEQLAAASGLSPELLGAALAGLEASGWVAVEPGAAPPAFGWTHALYAEAVLARTDAATVAGLHGVFAAMDLPVTERAHHGVRALTPPPDLDELLEDAAGAAQADGLLAQAALWWASLAERRRGDPEPRSRALLAQAGAVSRADPQAAIALYDEVIAIAARGDLVGAAAVDRADLVSRVSDRDEGIVALRAAITDAPAERRDDLEVRLASLLLSFGRGDEARESLASMASRGVPVALGLLAMFPYERGDLLESCRLLEEGLDRSEPGPGQLFILSNLAWTRALIGEWNAAERALAQAIPIAEQSGQLVRLWRLNACAITLDAWRGRVAAALDAGRRALRPAAALAPADVAGDVAHALAVALIASGSHDRAGEVLEAYATDEMPMFSIAMVEASLGRGALAEAKTHAARVHDAFAHDPVRAVTAARLSALVSLEDGDTAAAVSLLEPWIEAPSVVVFEQGRAMVVAAEALWRARRRTDALDAARNALRTFEQLGAGPAARATATWLEGRARTRRRREPGEVTAREREVLELAIQGLTNAQIAERLVLSPGTVKKHMENILARTGARRRSELHRYIRRLDG